MTELCISVTRAAIALYLCTASLASYVAIMFKSSNPIPLNNNKDPADLDTIYGFPEVYFVPLEKDSSVAALSLSGEKGYPLYCQKCKSCKPERTHHCKACNRCAPKMDQ